MKKKSHIYNKNATDNYHEEKSTHYNVEDQLLVDIKNDYYYIFNAEKLQRNMWRPNYNAKMLIQIYRIDKLYIYHKSKINK